MCRYSIGMLAWEGTLAREYAFKVVAIIRHCQVGGSSVALEAMVASSPAGGDHHRSHRAWPSLMYLIVEGARSPSALVCEADVWTASFGGSADFFLTLVPR